MKRLNLTNDNNRYMVRSIVTVIGMIVVMFYMIMSVRNLIQIFANVSLITANAGVISIIFNTILYLFVIATGIQAVRCSKNPYYIIIALVTILIIY